jgi:hypothetical protein
MASPAVTTSPATVPSSAVVVLADTPWATYNSTIMTATDTMTATAPNSTLRTRALARTS